MSTEQRSLRRSVFALAWAFIKKNGLSLSEALRIAWRNIKLKVALAKGIVKFTFQKLNGEIRLAFGTTKHELIPSDAIKGGQRKTNDTCQVFFDTEKGEFRSFKKINLLTIG